jgi:hypothetical protein
MFAGLSLARATAANATAPRKLAKRASRQQQAPAAALLLLLLLLALLHLLSWGSWQVA